MRIPLWMMGSLHPEILFDTQKYGVIALGYLCTLRIVFSK